jgi:hypothetical protein
MSMIACELNAKFCFWVFFFAILHLLYSWYCLATPNTVLYEFRGSQIFASSEEFGFKQARGTKRSRPGGEFLACSLSRDPRVAAVGPYWTVPCRGTRGRRSYLVSGTSVLSEKIWQREKKPPVLLRTSHARSEFASYDRKIPFPGSLQVVNAHPTRVNRPVTEHLVSQSPPSHSKRLLST